MSKSFTPFHYRNITDCGGYFYDETGNTIPADDRIEVMQYTGLKDKNGKEIYEGDIIKSRWKEYLPPEGNNEFIELCPPIMPDSFHFYQELDDMEVEVIGNRFENPELLTNKDE